MVAFAAGIDLDQFAQNVHSDLESSTVHKV